MWSNKVGARLQVSRMLRLCRCSHVRRHNNSGYQSIGSFHSENPEFLLRIPHGSYQPPPLPFQDDNHPDMPNIDFMLDNKWTFLNHGAFGASLSCAYRRAEQWRLYLEQQPLRYFDRDLLPHLVYTTRRLAQFLDTSPTNLALLPNVTAGLNAVIKGFSAQHPRGKIVLWETSYGSVKKIARTFCPDRVHEILFVKKELNSDPSEIICHALQEFLRNDGDWSNALLVVDHTASNTAINFPVQQLATIAKKHGMIVCVDGAHGLLAQPVHNVLPYVDIYLSNGHKWMSCPRGVALLYCASEELRETILRVPAVVSHGIDNGFFNRFVWDGTRDYASALAVPTALDYWETQGPNNVRAQIRNTLTQAVELLADMWHDGDLEKATLADHMQVHSPMALVRLPSLVSVGTSNDAKLVQDFLFHHFIEVPIKSVLGKLYVRLSCHVYNELHEYERLGNVMLQYSKA